MLHIIPKKYENAEQIIRKYKKKLEKLRLIKRLKKKTVHMKKSSVKRKRINKAILTQRYKQTKGLV